MQASFAERHLAPGQPSWSGSYSAADGTIRMYGTTGMPSATGELYASLRFAEPTLQLAGTSAGGLVPDPQGFETQLGPGAYATDLASRLVPGSLRLFVQAVQFDPRGAAPTHLAFPFVVAQGAGGPTATIPFGAVPMRVDPAGLGVASLLVDAGMFGPLDRLPAATTGGFDLDQAGVWNSAPLGVAPNRSLVGLDLWLQVLLTTTGLAPVHATNVVRLSLR
jgi:hypothetical protein